MKNKLYGTTVNYVINRWNNIEKKEKPWLYIQSLKEHLK